MNDEQLLLDEMNDFENFMENSDVEEIKKEHGLTTSFSSVPTVEPVQVESQVKSFHVGKFYNIEIFDVDDISVYFKSVDGRIVSKPINIDFDDNDRVYVIFNQYDIDVLGLDVDLIPDGFYDIDYSNSTFVYKPLFLYPPMVEPVQVESQVKSFEVGKFYNYYIVSRTLKQIKISRSNDDNSCVGSHSIYKYKDNEFICAKVEYLSGLVYDDTYYHRIFYCGKIQRVIISTTDFFSTLSDDDLVSLYKSKFDFSILDSSSTEIVPTVPAELVEPVQDEPIIEVIESPQDIHQRICNNFDIVEKTLYEICVDLKTIRDNKYYKQLGYDTFEVYCQECFNIKRRQAYNYISIAENLSSDFVQPVAQIGIRKLYCLSRLTDEQRNELLETTDIEHTPVKEVEKKAKEIKKNREVPKPVEPPKDTILDIYDVKSLVDSLTYLNNYVGSLFTETFTNPFDCDGGIFKDKAIFNLNETITAMKNMTKSVKVILEKIEKE